MKKIVKIFLLVTLVIALLPFNEVEAKTKISPKSKIIYVGETTKIKLKGNKKKVKWTKSNSKVKIIKKKKTYAKIKATKTGKVTITAKVGKKKYKSKITIKYKPGARQNPLNPKSGITIKNYDGTMYFKLQNIYKGKNAISKLQAMNEWDEYDQEYYTEYYPNTTVVIFEYYVKAASGYNKSPLAGLDIINTYGLYDKTCSKSINYIEEHYFHNNYDTYDSSDLELYGGASSKMYLTMFIPNGMTGFSNYIYDKNFNKIWIRYTF